MLKKLYTNSGLILVAILAAGIWTSNIQDFLSARPKPTLLVDYGDGRPQASPTPQDFDDFMRSRNTPQASPAPGKYDDFKLALNAPPGATAVCRDKTYNFSDNRRGACSRHGGVAQWLR